MSAKLRPVPDPLKHLISRVRCDRCHTRIHIFQWIDEEFAGVHVLALCLDCGCMTHEIDAGA